MSFAQLRGALLAHAAPAAIAAAFLVGACSQGEPQSAKAKPNVPLDAPQANAAKPRDQAEVDLALKERLARQDAASRLFDKSAPEPVRAAPPKAPEPSKPVEPVKIPEAKKAEPAKGPEPVKAAAAAPAAPVPETAKPPPPTPTPRVEVAAARPAPAAASAAAKLLSRIDPDFPREAIQAGVEQGNVKARMTLDGGGNVTRVEVVEAVPRRLFDRAVVRALSQWKFSDGLSGRTVETEVDFKR